ncbi:MAG: outer membrane lipoprotein carrier protein LolA [Proteobacteria bacterium]|nr:outer membrane lipoprotein carrier protein LolA [Pseudomonadota bacterium]MDA1021729.1 outer membrane lipoprotein carrier protein LolA [Pseudomonadota bacterium]
MSKLQTTVFTLILALTLAALPAPAPAWGQQPTPANLSPADRADVLRIEKYLNRIKTMQARFLQVSSGGDYSEGNMYFSKPGKMRLEYDAPKPVLIVSDGTNLAYIDKELKQVSYFDLASTQASVLLQEVISFSAGEMIITAFERGPGVLRLTLIKNDDPLEGNITLIFSDRPLGLKKWTVTDAQGIVTNISLLGPRFGGALDPELFDYREPDDAITTP